ncbi:MAG: hypothetical protein RLZZ303_2949 [Candidatus Hydrogenedentota bacterium]
MDSASIHETILSLGAFEPLSPAHRAKVADLLLSVGKPVSLGVDDVLIHEGDVGGGAGFVLLSGSMRVEQEGQPSLVLGAPALLGEMHQFNPRAQRTATVSAASPCALLKFQWFDFQTACLSSLDKEEQAALMEAMEQLVWQRFHHEAIFHVPAFAALEETARLRLCLTLVWIAQEMRLIAGEKLFEQHAPQNGQGYVLLDGAVAMLRAGEPFGDVAAPALLGAATELEPGRRWSATAQALGAISVMRFEWSELEAYLVQRLGAEETRRAFASIEQQAASGFRF